MEMKTDRTLASLPFQLVLKQTNHLRDGFLSIITSMSDLTHSVLIGKEETS